MKETSVPRATHAKLACGLLALLAALYGAPIASADPPSTPSPAWVTNGWVSAISPSDHGTLYLGGSFEYIGPPTGGGADLPVGGGDPLGPQIDGSVSAALGDGAGGWYVGGNFSTVGGLARENLAHILADGTLDQGFDANTSGGVQALARSGQTLYVGGSFSSIDGQSRSNLAAVDAAGNVTSWAPNPNGQVKALAISGSTLYAGGDFSKVGSQTRSRLAAIATSGSGSPTNWNPNANSTVKAIAVSGSTVYVGGSFTQVGGQARNRIAAISTGGAVQGWNASAVGNTVNAIEAGSGVVYVGGKFTQIGGQTRRGLAALSTSTAQATGWNPTVTDIIDSPYLSEEVHSLDLQGSTLYVGGDFYWVAGPQTLDDYVAQGQVRQNIAAVDASSGQLQGWDLHAGGRVYALASTPSRLYAGGSFSSVGGVERRYLAEVDIATGRATSWKPATIVASYGLWEVEAVGQTVYISGNFSSVGAQARDGLAAVSASSGAVTGWNPTAGGELKGDAETLAVSGSTVYAGGDFWQVAGQPRAALAAFDASTGALSAWNPGATDSSGYEGLVNDLALSGPTLYVGGVFARVAGQPRSNLAALDASSGTPTSWAPNPNGGVEAIHISWPTIYAGGYFSEIGGQPRQSVAAVDAGGAVGAFSPEIGGAVYSLGLQGQSLYVGGSFSEIAGQPRSNLGAIDTLFGTPTSWDPYGGSYVAAIATHAESVYAGGSYLSGGANGFAMFSSAPFNTVPPQISGTPTVGQTLTVSNGTWEGEVRSYSYRWLRNGEPISGASASSYQLVAADAGKAIGAQITASTLSESVTADADPVSVGGSPVNTSPPRISGAASVGRTLTAARGSWAGTPPLTYAYEWRRCESDGACSPIAGATAHRYVLTDEDLGKSVRVAVTATNGSGAASATSAPTAVVGSSRSSAEGPLAGILPTESPVGPVAGADPFVPPGSGYVAAVEQPNVTRKPYFNSYFSPSGDAFAPHGDPSYYVSTAVGDGLLFVGSQRREKVYAFDAATLAERYRFTALGVRGLAYADGEIYVVEHPEPGPQVGVYDAETGAPKRTLIPPLAHGPTADVLGKPSGIAVAFGEVWLAFADGPAGAGVMILDAQTGTLHAVTWHFGRYDCSLSPSEFRFDPARCLEHAAADTGLAQPAWWDISATPDLGGAFAGCRFINRETMLSALATSDIYVGDAIGSSDCATGRYTDPNGVLREASGAVDGTSAVPGMGWVLSMGPDASGDLGGYVREYDAGSSSTSVGAADLNLARSWRPRDHNSNNHRDIAYLNRDVRIDWSGDLTDSEWQRGSRCATYGVSDADIFVVGWRGERWYEPARTFERLDVKLDGLVIDTWFTPVDTRCLNLDAIPSGVHELTLLVTLEDGRQISVTNKNLRIDHDVPSGTVEVPEGWQRGTIQIQGTMADEHAGPLDWQLQVKHSSWGTWSDICTDSEADAVTSKVECAWNTNSGSYPDGTYSVRAMVGDKVDSSRGGPNAGYSAEASVNVDNTPPELLDPSPGVGTAYRDSFLDEVAELSLVQTDAASGMDITQLEYNTATDGSESGQWLSARSQPIQGEGVAVTYWDTTEVSDGLHRVRATGSDKAGNTRRLVWQIAFARGRRCPLTDSSNRRCYAGNYPTEQRPGNTFKYGVGVRARIETPGTTPRDPEGGDDWSITGVSLGSRGGRSLEVQVGAPSCIDGDPRRWGINISHQNRYGVISQPCVAVGPVEGHERHKLQSSLISGGRAAVRVDGNIPMVITESGGEEDWEPVPFPSRRLGIRAAAETPEHAMGVGGDYINVELLSRYSERWVSPDQILRADKPDSAYHSEYDGSSDNGHQNNGDPAYYCVHGPGTGCEPPQSPQ